MYNGYCTENYYNVKRCNYIQDVKTNQITHVINKIKTLIKKHTDILTDKETDYLINFETKCSNLYG